MTLVRPATGESVTTCDTNRRAALRCRVTDGQSFRSRLLPTDFTDFDQTCLTWLEQCSTGNLSLGEIKSRAATFKCSLSLSLCQHDDLNSLVLLKGAEPRTMFAAVAQRSTYRAYRARRPAATSIWCTCAAQLNLLRREQNLLSKSDRSNIFFCPLHTSTKGLYC